MYKTVALVGQPNSGKSTLFNVLSDIKVSTANFAGTTVEYKETNINLFGNTVHLIDLPGLYSLNPVEMGEFLTLKFLIENEVDLIINVIDSTLITRSLELTIELLELGIPIVTALNMNDEAQKKGIHINEKKLSEFLGVEVVKISALYGKGINNLLEIVHSSLIYGSVKPNPIKFTHHIDEWINKIQNELYIEINSNINPRFWAIKLLENPEIVPKFVKISANEILEKSKIDIIDKHKTELFEAFAYERHHHSMEISHKTTKYISHFKMPFIERLDLLLLKPPTSFIFGIFFLLAYFFLIFYIGGWIASALEDPLQSLTPIYEGIKNFSPLLWIITDGIYQGISGAIGIVLPYFLPLLILTAILEETGYLARVAFILDNIFHKIGLHGKSVAPFIMGFGCTVPAVYATRIIESRRDRLLASVLLNFIPCSARLTVIFALTTALTGPIWAIVILAYVLVAIGFTGKLLSLFLPKPLGMIMEIPQLRFPTFGVIIKKTLYKVKDFFKVAFPFLILGSIILSILDYYKVTNFINSLLQPFISGLLDLPKELGSTLIFGFLRKELAVLMTSQAFGITNLSELPLTITQVVVYIVFIIFYLPCISTSAVFWKEFGWRHLLLTVVVGLALSTFSAVLFKVILTTFFI
ncbi:MAG: ferrous iron transport protein B [Ignavibacteria bacterium]|nr:ferrous iron transport protein B [Ignavibacteria bacterium]